MSNERSNSTYSVKDFVDDVKATLSNEGHGVVGLTNIGTNLKRLVKDGGDLTVQGTPSTNGKGRIL